MSHAITTTELFLIAMAIIFAVPYLVWRLGRTDFVAPLVVVQVVAGVLLGPGVLGHYFPAYYDFVFRPEVVHSLNGIAWWAVMLFVMLAGIELDVRKAWANRGESGVTAGLALGVPLLFGCLVALGLLSFDGWIGASSARWQFVIGVGMACAVTALPVLMLLLDKLALLRAPIGQRVLRYASLDDIAIWAVLAFVLMDFERIGRQVSFLLVFGFACIAFRRLMRALAERDRWYVAPIWLSVCAFGADWSGLHFMVGAFLAGVVMDADWFERRGMDLLRHHLLLVLMPVYFLSTGLRTNFAVGGEMVLLAAAALLVAATIGKLVGVHIAGRILRWRRDEAALIGWLLQTKGLVEIVFANVLLDKGIITNATFTALLLMAVASTMSSVPFVTPKLRRLRAAAPELVTSTASRERD